MPALESWLIKRCTAGDLKLLFQALANQMLDFQRLPRTRTPKEDTTLLASVNLDESETGSNLLFNRVHLADDS